MSLCLVILTLAAQRDNTAIPSIPVSFYYTAFFYCEQNGSKSCCIYGSFCVLLFRLIRCCSLIIEVVISVVVYAQITL